MNRRGTILVAVLVLIGLAVLASAVLLYRAQAEVTASATAARRQQAYATAMSGVRTAMAVVQAAADDPTVWRDNPDLFRARQVRDEGTNIWYFTIYAHSDLDPETLRNGLTDEASKLNLNAADAETLANLPLLDVEQVDCLLDYRDQDHDPRPLGAEQDYYDQLPRPYLIRNGPLGSLEEILLVKGFTAAMVYGEDYNLNGLLERNEDDAEDSFPPDDADGVLDRGLMGTATVWSYERNVDNAGEPRVALNTAKSFDDVRLPTETVEFIELYRQEGGRFTHASQLLEMRYTLKKDHGKLKKGTEIVSGVGVGELATVLDRLTTAGKVLPGLVNVNTAPAEVLAALPGFDEDLAERVVGARGGWDPSVLATPAWLYTENIVSADRFKEIAPALTSRSFQFRVLCVGYGWPCGQFRVVEAVIDTALGGARIVYQRDLTRLGVPFSIEVEQEESMN